jgi:hypothetical protein
MYLSATASRPSVCATHDHSCEPPDPFFGTSWLIGVESLPTATSHPNSPPTSRAFKQDVLFHTPITDNVSYFTAVLACYSASCPITTYLARKDVQMVARPGSAGVRGIVIACFTTSPAKVSPIPGKSLDSTSVNLSNVHRRKRERRPRCRRGLSRIRARLI